MKGDPQVIEALNRALTVELTAINQYFCQAKMCKNWGFLKLAAKHYQESMGEMKHAEKLIARFGVRASSSATKAGKLSGGNLQKLILGREILENATAMVVEQPTRGLDVGAIESIWAELLSQREGGKAILLISAELEELMNLADRIAVMFEGRIAGILDAASVTSENLGLMISGLSEQA